MEKDAPKATLTSVVWNWGVYYTQAVQQVIDGTWTAENYFGGMDDGLVDITPLNEDLVAPGTQEKVDEARKKIVEDGFNVFDTDARCRSFDFAEKFLCGSSFL